MKINYDQVKNPLVGKKVNIKSKDSFHNGGWGTIIDFDWDNYHVAMYDGKNDVCIFSRDEIKVIKTDKGDKIK